MLLAPWLYRLAQIYSVLACEGQESKRRVESAESFDSLLPHPKGPAFGETMAQAHSHLSFSGPLPLDPVSPLAAHYHCDISDLSFSAEMFAHSLRTYAQSVSVLAMREEA
jgi:hypothetical protein